MVAQYLTKNTQNCNSDPSIIYFLQYSVLCITIQIRSFIAFLGIIWMGLLILIRDYPCTTWELQYSLLACQTDIKCWPSSIAICILNNYFKESVFCYALLVWSHRWPTPCYSSGWYTARDALTSHSFSWCFFFLLLFV